MQIVTTGNDQPDTQSLSYLAQIEDVETCRDVYGGNRSMRAAGKKYLTQYPEEDDDAYRDRLAAARLFNAYAKTVDGLTGMVFRKDPVLEEDVPVAFRGQEPDGDGQVRVIGHAENIDLTGRHLTTFARDVFRAKVIDGHTFIFVDWRKANGARSRREEEGARPYWIHLTKAQVIRWWTESRGGETVLVSFAYVELDTERDGTFGQRQVLRVRQYDLVPNDKGEERVQYQSWVKRAGKDKWTEEGAPEIISDRLTRIPLVCDYANRTGFFESTPPLLDLAEENIEHYTMRSDRKQGLKLGLIPIFVTTGVDKAEIGVMRVGAGFGLALPMGATADWKETEGNAFDASRQELQDITQNMAALGLAMLERQHRAAETAEAKRMDKTESDSQLAVMARATGDAMEEAIGFHVQWSPDMGTDGGSVTMNDDYMAQQLTGDQMRSALAIYEAEAWSVETLWAYLEEGNSLPSGFNADTEKARLEERGGASLEALREMIRGRTAEDAAEEDEDDAEEAA